MSRKIMVDNYKGMTAAEYNEYIRKSFIEPDKDVTSQVEFGPVDDEAMAIIRCVCGATSEIWAHTISKHKETAYINACPVCGAKLYFSVSVKVFQMAGETNEKGS